MLCVKHGADRVAIANAQERAMDMVFPAVSLLCGKTEGAKGPVLGKPTIECHKMLAVRKPLTIVRFSVGTVTPEHCRKKSKNKAKRQLNSVS